MITLHTRIRNLTPETDAVLTVYAERFNIVARHLASDMVREKRLSITPTASYPLRPLGLTGFPSLAVGLLAQAPAGPSFKNDYLRRFDITARQFNAVRQYVEGLANNRVENLKNQEKILTDKIQTTQKLLPKIEKQIDKARKAGESPEKIQRFTHNLHQKKRKMGNLLERQSKVIQAMHLPYASGLCFGGRKLFHSQFHLEDNGYKDHQEWLSDWRSSRISQFFVLGSKDETSGCQGCVARVVDDGSFMLDLRLPDGGDSGEKRITIGPLRFPYQEDKLRSALLAHTELSKKTLPKKTFISKNGKSYPRVVYPENLSALSWRFLKDKKGWRVMVSFDEGKPPIVTDSRLGVIGVDVNADHLAWSELDRFGNPVASGSISCVTYGKSTEQAAAIIESAAIFLSDMALRTGKPLVLEHLDFSKKKSQISEASGARYARMLSSLAYKKIYTAISVRTAKDGVAVKTVNPAYTSVLGRLHWADRYGLTVHEGAAVAIGRRELRLREVPAHRVVGGEKVFTLPDGRNGRVTLVAPVRKRSKHVWSYLSQIHRKLKAALAAQHYARKLDPPVHAVSDARKIPNATVAAVAQPPMVFAGGIPAREPPPSSFW